MIISTIAPFPYRSLPIANEQPVKDTQKTILTTLMTAIALFLPTAFMADAKYEHEKQQWHEDSTHLQDRRGFFKAAMPVYDCNHMVCEQIERGRRKCCRDEHNPAVASIIRRRSGNERDAREISGNVAASKIIAGEITMPNNVGRRAVPSYDCGTRQRRKHQYLDKGLRCDQKTEKVAIGAPYRTSSRRSFVTGALTFTSDRAAAIAPANRVEMPPTACINITSFSPPPKRKAIAVATSVDRLADDI